jgi:hypothetical protein
MSEAQSGPPPGWPSTPKATAQQAFTLPGDPSLPSFPPLDEAAVQKRRAVSSTTSLAPPIQAAVKPPVTLIESDATLPDEITAPHDQFRSAETPNEPPQGVEEETVRTAPVEAVQNTVPMLAPSSSDTLEDAPTIDAKLSVTPADASPSASAPKDATKPPRAPIPRVAIIAAIGLMLIAGTALGAFLYLRQFTKKPETSRPTPALALPKKSKKGGLEVEKTPPIATPPRTPDQQPTQRPQLHTEPDDSPQPEASEVPPDPTAAQSGQPDEQRPPKRLTVPFPHRQMVMPRPQ